MNPNQITRLGPDAAFLSVCEQRDKYIKALWAVLAFTTGANLYADKMPSRGALEAIAHIVKEALEVDQ